MIRFDRKWFNPLYFVLNEIIKDTSIRTVLVYGGKSSAKTVSICQILAKEAIIKAANTIAFRKESTIIRTTLKKSFNLAIDSMYLTPGFERFDLSYRTIRNSEIILKGLDSDEKAKGIESYKYVYLDELNHFLLSEYEQFNLSLRGMVGQKILASWNPVDENSWVKTDLIDKIEWAECDKFGKLPCESSFIHISTDGKTVLIKTTYEDNFWIVGSPCGTYGYRDENLINEYNQLRTRNYNSYKVNVLGEWGKTEFGGEFLKQWRSEKHVSECAYNPKCAVYLFFDENVNPYFPCGVFQVGEQGDRPQLIAELALKNPDNTVKAMGREITRKLRAWGHTGVVYIGGDATSRKDDVKQEKGHDLFRLLQIELKEFNPRMVLERSNPSVRMSADFVNSILAGDVEGLSFAVDKSCKTAILDFENTKEDKNGKVDKKTVTDPITKVSYQPFGHWVDIFRYFTCTIFAREYAMFQRQGSGMGIYTGGNADKNKF